MPSADDLDAVTLDAMGTLVELVDPTDRLRRGLADLGVERSPDDVARAFRAEVDYYIPRSHEGRDAGSLRRLRLACAQVILDELAAPITAEEFLDAFVASLEFRVLDGVPGALDALRTAGLRLACVTNWDCAFPEHLAGVGLADRFDAVVTSAEAGVQKPDPAVFRLAVERLGVRADRALHVGDSPADAEGARAAGIAFEPAPVATLPARLGLPG